MFDKFYYKKDDSIRDLSEIQEEYEKNNGDISKYRGYIFCPECKKAELSFTHKTSKKRAFLSKLPTSNHKEDCSYKYDSANSIEIREFIDTLGEDKIKDRLEATLNKLLPKETKGNLRETEKFEINLLVILKKEKNSKHYIKKTIPQRALSIPFCIEEKDKVFIFYGTVKLEINEVKKNVFMLKLLVEKNNKLVNIVSIYREKIKDEIDTSKVYDISIYGSIDFYNNFQQIKPIKSFSFMLRERIS